MNTYYISSNDRRNSDTTGDFTVKFPLNKTLSSFAIDSVSFQKTYYYIRSTNNQLAFNDGINNLIATISPGSYSANDFIAALKDAMENPDIPTGLTFTPTISSTTGKLTILGSANFSLLLADVGTTINEILGFDAVNLAGNLTYTGQKVVQLNDRDMYVDVVSDYLTQFDSRANTSGQSPGNLLIRVPALGGFGDTVYHEPESRTFFNWDRHQKMGTPDFKLLHRDGTAVDLNGGEVCLRLLIND